MTPKTIDPANAKPGEDDIRLKSILPVIATQLIPVQKTFADFAKAMLKNTTDLRARLATLEKFDSTIDPPYIPKSARVNIKLQYSNGLANETNIKDLEKALLDLNNSYMNSVTEIFKKCAEEEVQKVKRERIVIFNSYLHQIALSHVIYYNETGKKLNELSNLDFASWICFMFMKQIKNLGFEAGFYEDYLHSHYNDLKANLYDTYLHHLRGLRDPAENFLLRSPSNEELDFITEVVNKLNDSILPCTIRLQETVDKEARHKKAEQVIAANFKKAKIISATEATALAVNDISSNNKNMEQYLKQLIQDQVKEHLKTAKTSNTKKSMQKNAQGGKRPRSLSPEKEEKGKKQVHHTKRQKNTNPPRTQRNDSSDKPSDEQSISSDSTSTKHPNHRSNHRPNQNSNQRSNQRRSTTRNGSRTHSTKKQNQDHQEGKKQGGRNDKRKQKN